jgi:hypothetical protein
MSAKFKEISHRVLESLPDVSGAASEHSLVDESGVLELRWGCIIGQKMAAVLGGTLYNTQ